MKPLKSPRPPLRLSRQQVRAIDEYAMNVLAIPGVVLMENAGRGAADHIARWMKLCRTGRRPPRAAIVCGKGNNGGDGFVIARHLANRGCDVQVDLYGDPATLPADAAVNYAVILKMGLPVIALSDESALVLAANRWRRCDIVIDALLGTGFEGQVRESLASVVHRINALKVPLIVAVDLPSGLDANQGCTGGAVVRAHRTVTFVAEKSAMANRDARRICGRITVADICVDRKSVV